MITTVHSFERAKERIGMNPRAEHFMKNALERGKDKSMFTCEKFRWLKAKEDACGYKALVYNDMCLIVSREDAVITMYRLPGWFRKSCRYSGKERIRNRAKFERFNRRPAEAGWVM